MTYNASDLASLSDERYMDIVTRNIRRSSGDEALWEVLLSKELIERTASTLKQMLEIATAAAGKRKNEINQIRIDCTRFGKLDRSTWARESAIYEEWRTRNSHLKQIVQERLGQVREARRATPESRARLVAQANDMSQRASDYRTIIRELARAVHQHQALSAASGTPPEQHDYDLWRVLDELTVPVGPEQQGASLRSMLRTYWFDTSPSMPAEDTRHATERLMRQAPAGRSERFQGSPKVRRIGSPNPLS
jgi:hypothetical protein